MVDERLANGHKHSYVFDSLGSVVGVTDPIGTQLVDTYSYDPTGNILTQTGTVPNNWQYAGGYFNQNTGLTKFGTRYYDPTLGRWTQQDPVGGSLGNLNAANRYIYAADDPVNEVDPSGRDSCFDTIVNSAVGVLVADLEALGAFVGYAAAADAVNVAAAQLEAAIAGTGGDVATALAAVGTAELFQAAAIIGLLIVAVILFQTFSQNANAIQAACG